MARPFYVDKPAQIGVGDLAQPDCSDPPEGNGVPAFWACGVKPQATLREANLPFAITHEPGKTLVCDVPASFDKLPKAPQ